MMLNISKQIYSGWSNTAPKYDLPEAEIVPLGKTANEKNKLSALTKKFPNLKEYDNVPLPGFTLYTASRKSWGSLDQSWLVIDPRGFLVRITTDNLEKILHVTGITEGLIQEKCVWARENSQTKMQLIPVSSPDYIKAMENTELIENKVDKKDINIGDTVITQSGVQGTYMGVLSLYGTLVEDREIYSPQTFLRRQIIEYQPGKYFYRADANILKVIKKAETPMTRQESADYINLTIKSGQAHFSAVPNPHNPQYYGSYGRITHVSVNAIQNPILSLEEIDKDSLTPILAVIDAQRDSGKLFIVDKENKTYIIDASYGIAHRTTFEIELKEATLSADTTHFIPLKEKSNSTYNYWRQSARASYTIDQFDKVYKIIKNVKDETYF